MLCVFCVGVKLGVSGLESIVNEGAQKNIGTERGIG